MPHRLTVEQLKTEREAHMSYLSGLLAGKVVRPLGSLVELRLACKAQRAELEAQRERLRAQRVQLEDQMLAVEEQLLLIRQSM